MSEDSAPSSLGDLVTALPVGADAVDVATAPSADSGWVGLGGAESLSWAEADRVAARHGATLILIAGNQESGKTTLLLQLWAQFLRGPFAEYRFAGSDTLDAFDDRHYPCRVDSGSSYPSTDHTTDTDTRFLHLLVADRNGERHALLMTDLWGELFKDIATGAKVSERVPVAPRADKTILIIDGEEVAEITKREAAMRNAKTLIGAFASVGDGLRLDAPLMVLLSKLDAVEAAGPNHLEWYERRIASLVEFAASKGFTRVEEHVVAARPPDADPKGLERVLAWMCAREERIPVVEPEQTPGSNRVFTTGKMGRS